MSETLIHSPLQSWLPRWGGDWWLVTLTVTCGAAAVISGQTAADVKGSRDHPMISRVEGSTIKGFERKEFDEYRLITGTVSGFNDQSQRWSDLEEALNDRNSIRLEGAVWKLTYDVPKNRSTLEIVRSYQTALSQAGFQTLFQCTNRECAGAGPKGVIGPSTWLGAFSELMMKRAGYFLSGGVADDQRYVAARLARAGGDVYVSVLALGLTAAPLARVDVIEVKPPKTLVDIDAARMATDIATAGSVAVYGVYFDNDRAEIKPDSRETLSQIAALLKQNDKLELIVVGHTDNNGSLEHNLDLSLRRAQAVVASLGSEFGIARNRLEARGVGFLAPVAPNTSEENRARNRRVQLLPR